MTDEGLTDHLPIDEELIERLRRYRPVDVSAGLRSRALAPPIAAPHRHWQWMLATAALLASVVLTWQASRSYDDLAGRVITEEDPGTSVIDAMTAAWGGTEASRQAARRAVDTWELQRQEAAAVGVAPERVSQ